MTEANWTTFLSSMLFTVGLQIVGRDWPFVTRLGALLIVAPVGALVGGTLALIGRMAV